MTKYTIQREAGAKLTRDVDGKIAPQFGPHWLAADAAKAERLAKRTFTSADVTTAQTFGVDADELFA